MPKVLVSVLLVLLLFSLALNVKLSGNQKEPDEKYLVSEIIDGDTFKLDSGKRVRLLGVNAPEMGRCLSNEAKDTLSKEVLGKAVTLSDNHPDPYGRIIANVFVGEKYINEVLIKKGLARPDYDSANTNMEILTKSYAIARKNKIGVNSEKCLQNKPPNPKCAIKANVGRDNKLKAYYLPGCITYSSVRIDLSAEDAWFCTQAEAKKAGFVKAPTCN